VHADDARPHIAKVMLDSMERNAMKRAPHPSYSLDLTSSDFYLFSHVKKLLRGYEFADREALLHAIEDILSDIEKRYWKTFFSAGWRDPANMVAPLENM
jgi:hypothetical protein